MPAEQGISRDSFIRHYDDNGVYDKRSMPSYGDWMKDPVPAPHKTYVETAQDYLSDVQVSDKTIIEGNQQYFDQQALYTLNDPSSSEEEKAQARAFIEARSQDILRQHEEDMKERSLIEDAKKAGKGLLNTLGGVGRGIQSEFAEAQRRPTGDIDVRAYDYTNKDGKRVHVKNHKRKRS